MTDSEDSRVDPVPPPFVDPPRDAPSGKPDLLELTPLRDAPLPLGQLDDANFRVSLPRGGSQEGKFAHGGEDAPRRVTG